jgi:putative ABC transport system permease protein
VRRALGGSRVALFRQLFGESLVIAIVAGLAGGVIAFWGVKALVLIAPETIVRWHYYEIRLNGRALQFAGGLTLVTAMLFGMAPAIWAARRSDASRGGSRTATVSRSHMRMRQAVQVAQLALATLLLCGAALLARSFVTTTRVDPGYDVDHTLRVSLSQPGRPGSAERIRFVHVLSANLERIAGLERVAWSNGLGLQFSEALLPEGADPVPTNGRILISTSIDTAWFATTGVRLLEGRGFTAVDIASAEPDATILDRDLAELLWPGRSAIGRQLRTDANGPLYTVVGVAADAKLHSQDDRDMPWAMYLPSSPERFGYTSMSIRSAGNPAGLIEPVRTAIHDAAADLPIYDLMTARQSLAEELDLPRFVLTLMVVFASLALMLAVIGVYGLVSFSVTQRQRELGLRLAIGAQAQDVLKDVMRTGLVMAVAGVAFGLAGAVALSRYIESLLFGIGRNDPLAYGIVAIVLVVAAMIAQLRPALHAARLDPATTLRSE